MRREEDTIGPVLFYEDKYYMFSNFSAFSVEWKSLLWMTSEHAYQAAKFEDPSLQDEIRYAKSAYDAKAIAEKYSHKIRHDWKDVKLDIMEEIIRAKLSQHPYIYNKLLETNNRLIIEDSPIDYYWGAGEDRTGENHLGKLWMKIRDEVKSY